MNSAAFPFLTDAPVAQLEPAGYVLLLRCEPDPYRGEWLNVGVAGIDRAGRRAVRVIEEPGRLACLYGADTDSVLWLAKLAAESFLEKQNSTPSPQIQFSDPLPYYHKALQEAVDETFADTVTVALPDKEPRRRRKQVTHEDAWRRFVDVLKQRSARADEIIATVPHVFFPGKDGRSRHVYAPLQPPNGAGTLRSADYAPGTLRVHLMEAVLDIECAGRVRSLAKLGLFILRPAQSDLTEQVDEVIDSVAYRASREMTIEVSDTVTELADAVDRWAA